MLNGSNFCQTVSPLKNLTAFCFDWSTKNENDDLNESHNIEFKKHFLIKGSLFVHTLKGIWVVCICPECPFNELAYK